MKRGGPIERRTPLARSGPIRSTPREPRRTPIKSKTPRRGRMDPALRDAVLERAEGLCDLCGIGVHPDAWDCHHRKLRSRGGGDTLDNLVCLHPGCHAAVHAKPADATAAGFIVPSGADPADVPIRRHMTTHVYPSGTRWATTTRSEE